MVRASSFSGSGTQMSAALFLYLSRCLSTQLSHALSLPPVNHFQKGGSLVSSTLSHRRDHRSMSAYSSKHFGKFFSAKRSLTAESLRFACRMKLSGGE